MKILILVLFFTSQVFAAEKNVNLRISKANGSSSGCDLNVVGFNSKEQFFVFFDKLKQAAASKDKNMLGDLMHFPLNTYAKDYPTSIKTKEDFVNDFDKVMPQKLLDLILKQKVDEFFCRDQGVMIHDGEIWISIRNNQPKVITLNSR